MAGDAFTVAKLLPHIIVVWVIKVFRVGVRFGARIVVLAVGEDAIESGACETIIRFIGFCGVLSLF